MYVRKDVLDYIFIEFHQVIAGNTVNKRQNPRRGRCFPLSGGAVPSPVKGEGLMDIQKIAHRIISQSPEDSNEIKKTAKQLAQELKEAGELKKPRKLIREVSRQIRNKKVIRDNFRLSL